LGVIEGVAIAGGCAHTISINEIEIAVLWVPEISPRNPSLCYFYGALLYPFRSQWGRKYLSVHGFISGKFDRQTGTFLERELLRAGQTRKPRCLK
jgi:hypothetical protein